MADFFWPLMILLAALGLVMLELLLPSGGALGVLAALAYLAAIVAGYMQGGFQAGTLFMMAAVGALPLLLYAFVRWWPHTAMGRRVIMHPPDEKEVLPESRLRAADWVGRQGVAVAPMLPTGAVRIDGRVLDAASEQGSIEGGSIVRVVGVRDNRLVVRCETLPGNWERSGAAEKSEEADRVAAPEASPARSELPVRETPGPAKNPPSAAPPPAVERARQPNAGPQSSGMSGPVESRRPDIDLEIGLELERDLESGRGPEQGPS